MIKPRDPLDVPGKQIELGMSRFFTEQNLDRYRRLASDVITATERQQVLELLSKEMSAFRD